MLSWKEEAKRRASLKAVKHVLDGHIVGLGSGSTVEYAIRELGRRIREEELKIKAIPSSIRSARIAIESGVPLTTLDEEPQIDIAIDGADQIDANLNLIKGKGGAFAREKVLDSIAKQFIVVADESKLSKVLGVGIKVPIEVLPFATNVVMKKINELGGRPSLREAKEKLGPIITDNGNFIIDVTFGPIKDPKELDSQIKLIPGVVETGLFIGIADLAYIGCRRGIKVLRRKR